MNAGTMVGLLILVAIPVALFALAEPIMRLQVSIMQSQAAWLRSGRGAWLVPAIGGVLILLGAAVIASAIGASDSGVAMGLYAFGGVIALIGLAMIVFRRPFARFQLAMLDWQAGFYERHGTILVRGFAVLLLVAMIGGFVAGSARR